MRNIRPGFSVAAGVFAACALAFCAAAQDIDDIEDDVSGDSEASETQESEASAEAPAEAAAPVAPASAKNQFYQLVRCVEAQGEAYVFRIRTGQWEKVQEGKYYPMGSKFKARRTSDVLEGSPAACFAFGEDCYAIIDTVGSFSTRPIDIGEKTRTVVLESGVVKFSLPLVTKPGSFSVVAPHFTSTNLAGESQYTYTTLADGEEIIVRVITGTLSLSGAHYSIERMNAANRLRIRTTGDDLETFLRGESGNFAVTLDQGIERRTDFSTGEKKDENVTLVYNLSPKCAIKIFRRRSETDDRMLVNTMTFDPHGRIVNRRAFAENRYNVNSGELVLKPQQLPKQADKSGDTTAVDVTPTEEDVEEEAGEEDSSGSDDSSGGEESAEEDDMF